MTKTENLQLFEEQCVKSIINCGYSIGLQVNYSSIYQKVALFPFMSDEIISLMVNRILDIENIKQDIYNQILIILFTLYIRNKRYLRELRAFAREGLISRIASLRLEALTN